MDDTLSYPAAKSNVGPPPRKICLWIAFGIRLFHGPKHWKWVNPHPPRVFPQSYGNPWWKSHSSSTKAEASGFPIIGAQGSPRSAIQQRWKSSKLWTRLGRHCKQGFSILRAAWKWWVRWAVAWVDTWIKIFQEKEDVLEGPGCSKRKVEKNIFCKNDMKNHLSIPPCFWYASARTVLALP